MSRRKKWKEWEAMYEAWKSANPKIAGDDFKQYRRNLVRGCSGKTPYETYAAAMAIVTVLPVRDGRFLHAYECPICKKFHVGNTSAKGKMNHEASKENQ